MFGVLGFWGVEKLDAFLFFGPLGLDVIPGFEINGSFCCFFGSEFVMFPNRM